jgi:glutathione S-transferase
LRWVGRNYKFYPSDPELAWIVDSNLDAVVDFMAKVYTNAFSQDPEVKKKLTEEILTVDFPNFCKRMNARIEKNSNKLFIAGDSMTIADIQLCMIAKDWYNAANPHSPALLEMVGQNPALKNYVEHHIEKTFAAYFSTRVETMI